MDKNHTEKIEDLAILIHKFQSLAEQEKSWLLPLLNKGVLSALEILDYAPGRTYKEIASHTGLNISTVKQKLKALERGGHPIRTGNVKTFRPDSRGRKTLVYLPNYFRDYHQEGQDE
jgi:DNA-binding MarR family transcriptional regulator